MNIDSTVQTACRVFGVEKASLLGWGGAWLQNAAISPPKEKMSPKVAFRRGTGSSAVFPVAF